MAGVVPAESCYVVLETQPPDYVEEISQYLGSSVGQNRQEKVSNGPAEAESDSGDSLFITQKPVPEAVRSGGRRRCRYSVRSDPTSPRDLEENESDTSSSTSHGESKKDKKSRGKKCKLPKYSFLFVSGKKWKPRSTLLPVYQNISLHYSALGGFFKCVRELRPGYQRGDDVESSLPTVDMEGDYISPLSEEEEERSEDEDIKVVERKHFVAPSKAKSQQTWCNQVKQQRRKAGNASQETSRGRQWKTLHETPAKASVSRVTAESTHTEISDDGESSRRVLAERVRNDEHVTSDENFLAQTETPKTKRRLTRGNKKILFQQKAGEEELCDDSDATVCEPHELQTSPRQHTQKGREASTTVTEPQTDVFHTDEPESQNLLHSLPDLISDTNNDSVCNETRVKKRKKKKKDKGDHESVEEEKGQSQEEPEGPRAATCVNVEVEETPSLSEDNRAEPPASQACDELEFNENNCMENSSHDDTILRQEERDIPDSTQKKKKRKKKSAAENVRQEVDGNLESDVRKEDSVFSVSCNVENGGKKKKKKKRKRSDEDDEDVEQLQSSSVAEPLNDDAEIKKKKKKRKKEERIVIAEEREEEEASNRTLDLPPMSMGQLEESGNCSENTAASQETLESSYVKRKKHKKKQQSSSNDATQDEEEGVDVSFSNDAVTLAESTGMSLKKKKKKKKKKNISEGADISYTPEENEEVENVDNTQKTKEGLEEQNAELVTKKKKKKKKMSETSSKNIPEDNVAQSDDSVSVREKEKKRTSSFLVADAEENDARREQNSPSQSVDAHVWDTQKPGVRKKKRKRKMSAAQDGVEKDHEQDFEEPNKTCQSAFPEATDTGVKRKKKRMGNESELVTPMERLESAADAGHSPTDEAVVLKKKKKKKKKRCSAEISNDSRTSDQLTNETLNMVEHASPSSEAPGNQALNDMRDKKKKKKMKSADNVLPEGKSLTKSAELEPQENEKKERNTQSAVPNIISSSPMLPETSLSKCKMSSSDSVMKNKHIKVKRRLLNPSEDFFTDN